MDLSKEELLALKSTLKKTRAELCSLEEERKKEDPEPEITKKEPSSSTKTYSMVSQHQEPNMKMKDGIGGGGGGGGGVGVEGEGDLLVGTSSETSLESTSSHRSNYGQKRQQLPPSFVKQSISFNKWRRRLAEEEGKTFQRALSEGYREEGNCDRQTDRQTNVI